MKMKTLAACITMIIVFSIFGNVRGICDSTLAIDSKIIYDVETFPVEQPIYARYAANRSMIDVELAQSLIKNEYSASIIEYPDGEKVYEYTNDVETLEVSTYGYLRYNTDAVMYANEIVVSDAAFSGIDLDFMDAATAEQLCIDVLKGIGIDAAVTNNYGYDVETLKALSDDARQDLLSWQDVGKEVWMKDEWLKEDECYLIKLCYVVCGTPILDGEDSGDFLPVINTSYYDTKSDTPFAGPQIEAIVTANGVEYMRITNNFNLSEVRGDVEICSQELVMDNFANEVAMILDSPVIKIVDMYLKYIPAVIEGKNPRSEFELTPAWIMVRELEQEGERFYAEIMFDATTGERL